VINLMKIILHVVVESWSVQVFPNIDTKLCLSLSKSLYGKESKILICHDGPLRQVLIC
jgi:hypothetical protein